MDRTILMVYGPYNIPYRKIDKSQIYKSIDQEHLDIFWENVSEKTENERFHLKKGCYIFAIKSSKGTFVPYYVGKTGSSGGLGSEAFSLRNWKLYNDLLSKGMRGTPYMFFISTQGNTTRMNRNIIDELEKYLIIHAKLRNDNLINSHHTKLPTWGIEGVLRHKSRRPSKIQQDFKRMLGL